MGANAQTSVPTFTAGQILTAAQMNNSARTGVPVFATTTTRNAAFGSSPLKTLAQGQLCYLEATNTLQYYDGTSWINLPVTFNARTTVTATNATWPVPTLRNPIVKVTVIGGGGGGGGGRGGGTGGTGGTTTFASGQTFAVAATGGVGGAAGGSNAAGNAGQAGFSAGNQGSGGDAPQNVDYSSGHSGQGGQILVAYCDLTGFTTLNLIIGAGGTAGTAGVGPAGGAGGRGEIIVEYAS